MSKVKIIASDKAKHLKAGETYEVTHEIARLLKAKGYTKEAKKTRTKKGE